MIKNLRSFSGWAAFVLLLAAPVLNTVLNEHRWIAAAAGAVGLAALALFLILNRGEIFSGFRSRQMKEGAGTGIYAFLVVAVVIVVNVLAARHARQWDMTAAGIYSLSPQSAKIARELDRDVEVKAFFTSRSIDRKERFEDLVKLYELEGEKISASFIDPLTEPQTAGEYDVNEDGTVILTSGDARVKLEKNDEEGFTRGLIRLTGDKELTVCFLSGHGEPGIESAEGRGLSIAAGELENMNLKVRELMLAEEGGVPEDCSLLVVCNPTGGFLSGETDVLSRYIEEDGRALFLLNPDSSEQIVSLPSGFGIDIGEDIVIETGKLSRLLGGDIYTPLINSYPVHPITEGFDAPSFFPTARSVVPAGDEEAFRVKTFARSSETSWAEKDKQIFQFDEGEDIEGPVSLAVAAERVTSAEDEGGEGTVARIAVFGDSDFISNDYFGLSGNGNLFLNTVNWLIEREDLISVTPATRKASVMILNRGQGGTIFWLNVAAAPLVPMIIGLVVWLRRRNL